MPDNIHPTAIIDPRARIGREVEIGPYSVIGADVVLGDRCRLHHQTTIVGETILGEECEVFPQAILGTRPQDLKYQGERTRLVIGKRNVFREMVTAHPGTANGGGITEIADHNLFLVGVHVAHDCRIGSHCIIANYTQFAGHVHVEDHVNLGGHSAVHHFVTIGRHAFIGGMTRVAADVPPFVVVVAARGTRTEVRMINGVGLQRCGFSHEDIGALKEAYMKLFSRRARMNGTAIRDRVQALLDSTPINDHVHYLCESLMRSFAHGRHGRYLESLRHDPVHRSSWTPERYQVAVNVVGLGSVKQCRHPVAGDPHVIVELTAEAKPGWRFSGWNGGLLGQENPQRVRLDRDLEVAATFTPAG